MCTIVALSSGAGRAAIAVIRISGPQSRFVFEMIGVAALPPRRAQCVTLRDPASAAVIDAGLALWFPGPASATGEDVLELHLHGSLAVVRRALAAVLTVHPTMRLAEPGEFSRRALENGKLDLLQVEGLGDLLAAETDAQLAQAQRQMAGALSEKVRQWQDRLTALRAHVEAALDFADEGDVVAQADQGVRAALAALSTELTRELQKAHQGQRIRDGYSVVIVGPPNVGKSTLMNALAARDVAIVTDRPGTTRDLLEWSCVIQGLPVVMVDTAGLRETGDAIEAEGIRRARARAAQADLVLLLASVDTEPLPSLPLTAAPIIRVMTKGDLPGAEDPDALVVCAQTGDGLAALRAAIGDHLAHAAGGEPALVSRERQRLALAEAVAALERAQERREDELVAEELRLAARHLGRLVGHVDVETVLDRLFEGFCIGK